MECFERAGEVEITDISEFDLVKTFECGQCFRWNADENGVYTGVAYGRAASLRCVGGSTAGSVGGSTAGSVGGSLFISGSLADFEALWRHYFDLDRDYGEIRRRLCTDDFMREATEFGSGIRILRQDSWEALCSFIISQCNNIPRIKKIISTLCREFGEKLDFDPAPLHASINASLGSSAPAPHNAMFYSFPSAERLAGLSENDLAPLRCGYRAEYILNAARAVAEGRLDLDVLARGAPDQARLALKKLRGVGDKVADCTLLYGLNMLDAFPLDVWMKRAVAKRFGPGFDPGIFSPYAGLAQQYIFYHARSEKA